MAARALSVVGVSTFVTCCWTIVSGTATALCDIYEWDQLGSPGVLDPTCFGFPLEGFRIFSKCSTVRNMEVGLKEVPMDVDTLCLVLQVRTIPTGSFSRYQNLTRLYLCGSFHVSARAFSGIANLRHLGIGGEYIRHVITIDMDEQVFGGLENLTRLDLRNVVMFEALQKNLFKPLHRIQVIDLSENRVHRIYRLTTMLQSLVSVRILGLKRNGVVAARALDCISTTNLTNSTVFSPRISILDLSSNELKIVEENSFCNFPHLTVFKADATGLKVINLLSSGIKSIEILSLNAMKIYLKIKDVCTVVSRLGVRNLTVAQNFISSLPAESFEGCSSLLSLNMSDNRLWAFTNDMAKKLLNLRSLVLSVNKIKSLDLCTPGFPNVLSNLTHLDLSFNRITNIGSGRLFCLANLETIDLSSNYLVFLEKDTFVGLDRLQSLQLDYNKLFLLENFYFDHLSSVRVLGLRGNSIKTNNRSLVAMNKLQELSITFETHETLNIKQEELTSLTLEAKQSITLICENNCSLLEVLNISAPQIYIDSCMDLPLKSVKQLHLHENHAVDCFPLGISETEHLGLTSFTNVEHLYYSSSANMHFYKSFSPLNGSLQLLHNLHYLHLGNLKLDIKKSFLTPEQLFWNLTHLRTLILEDTGIEHFTDTMFRDLVSLELLIFKSQPVKTLQEGLFDHMESLRYIYLNDVPLDCSCEQAWIRRWVATHPQVRVPKLGIHTCSLGSQKMNYLHFLEKDCSLMVGYPLFIGTFSFHMLFLITALLYHKMRWYLLYLFYMLRTWWDYRGRRDRQRQYDFDAFVSYSSCDEAWVVREFLPNLEERGPPFFKVCLHGRDFEVGKDIMDNIVDSIYRSRWVVCLISRHYLRSHWCSLEVRMATYRLLAERKDSLVMVFLEKVSTRSLSRYHQLAKLVKKKTYLEWEEDLVQQPLFWARLRKAIGGDGIEQQEIVVK
ncbi:toll-like receptor 13 [Pleurodeles waltl]|uniref:toll-like receptor 13 n=1 Tax=Pleurodeles waltl TaxID=8319 RepID=UPI0037095619